LQIIAWLDPAPYPGRPEPEGKGNPSGGVLPLGASDWAVQLWARLDSK